MAKKQLTFLEKIREDYGDAYVNQDAQVGGHPSISTGSLALDVSTGIGGIPYGRYTELFGPESCGKTTLCLTIAREALKVGNKVLYLDVENSVDFDYAKKIIGEYYSDKIVFVQPSSGESAFEIAEAGIDNNFNLIIFDSIAALAPMVELEEDDYEKQQYAVVPRLVAKFLRKTNFKVRSKGIAVIITNQVRAKIGAYYPNTYETPAGYALKHYSSMIIFLTKGEEIKNDKVPVGNLIKFVIKKNKLAVPYRESVTNNYYGKGVDPILDTIAFATSLGIIKSRGPYLAFDEEIIGLGMEKTAEAVRNNKELLDKITMLCYSVTGVEYPPVREININADTSAEENS
jgi:recombination protein RecA